MPKRSRWLAFVLSATTTSLMAFSGISLAADNMPTKVIGDEKINEEKNNSGNILLLRPRINKALPKKVFLEALDISGKVFLSLTDLVQTFDFPIKIDAAQSIASGFFLGPENTFHIDVEKREIQVRQGRWNLLQDDIRKHNGKLYISTDNLSKWFNINSEIDRLEGLIHLTTEKKLPAEEMEERAEKWRKQPVAEQKKQPDETHTFSGTTEPEYQVELYRNGEPVAFQIADFKGQYSFANIPLMSGENTFRFVFYGPQGQRAEKTESIGPLQSTKPAVAPKIPEEKKASEKNIASMAMKNWSKLDVVRDDKVLGGVESYTNLKGTFVRLDSLIRMLDLSYKRSDEPESLDIVLKDNSVISLNLKTKSYTDNNQRHTLYDNDAFSNDDNIYVNITLLNRFLPPFRFVEDLAGKRLNVTESAAKAAEEIKSDIAPPPLAAPVEPVIVDNLAGEQKVSAAPQKVIEANDVIVKEEEVSKAVSSAPSEDDGEKTAEVLIMQPRIKMMPPKNEFLEIFDKGGRTYLPLNDVMQLFEFPIKIDSSNKVASGYFISPQNVFHLDLEKRTVSVGSEHWDLAEYEVQKQNDQIYVSTESFTKWFSIACDVNRSKSLIHFTTDKVLPEEERNERQKKWQKLIAAVGNNKPEYPLLQNDYQAIGYPAMDVTLGATYTHSESFGTGTSARPFVADYNVQGSADLAYMTSQFYAQGSTDGTAMDSLRLQMGRKDPNGELLGGLKATEFSFGDITSSSLTLVTTNSLGRGFSMSNRELNAPENFDYRNFTGDSMPGYEVELYRNNVLVAFQTVDSSGRYNFTNIPILYGENTFRILFYGPQGQREERVETVSASNALLKENQFVYTFSADQRGSELIPINNNTSLNPYAPAGLQLVGGFRYGLTQDITLGAAAAETKMIDGNHQYVTATAGANIAGLLTETNFARDFTNNGWAGSVSTLTGFEGVSLRARYRKFKDFMSEAVNNNSVPLASDASLEGNTQFYLPVIGDYGFGLSALREEFVDENLVPRYTYGWRSSKSLWGLSFTNTVDYVVDEDKKYEDTFGVQTHLWNISWRAVGTYEFKPNNQFREASFMADYRFSDRLSGQTQIDKYLTGDTVTTFGQNINWDFDQFRLSFNGQVDDKAQYVAGLNVLFSINHNTASNRWRMQPRQTSNGGAIAGRVFMDGNSNGQLDDGEQILQEARLRVNRMPASQNEEGFFVAPVSPYEISRIELEQNSLKDPMQTPTSPGFQVMTRPGDTIVVDFPLVQTTVIDGEVILLDVNGNKRELSDIIVELEDKDGKPLNRVISAVDGYFSFDKVKAGEYWLSVPEEALSAINAAIENKVHILIEEVGEFITGKDLVLREKEKQDTSPPPLAP